MGNGYETQTREELVIFSNVIGLRIAHCDGGVRSNECVCLDYVRLFKSITLQSDIVVAFLQFCSKRVLCVCGHIVPRL